MVTGLRPVAASDRVDLLRQWVRLPERDWLLARLAAVPDLTIRGPRAALAYRSTRVSYDAVWRGMHRAQLHRRAG